MQNEVIEVAIKGVMPTANGCAALEVDRTIMLEKPRVLEQAQAWKIHLHGYS